MSSSSLSARRSPTLRLLAALLLVGAAGCIDVISSAGSGVFSISPVISPAPAVVLGDTLRDSLGIVTPLRVVGLAGNGDTVGGQQPTFVLLDKGGLHVDAGGRVIGDSIRAADASAHASTVRVVATLAGLQTPPLSIDVVLEPNYVTRGPLSSTPTEVQIGSASDSLALLTVPLPVYVWHRESPTDTVPVRSWRVSYEIVSQPHIAQGSAPGAMLSDESRNRSALDTTTADGRASRQLLLRVASLTRISAVDTVVVQARVTYKGQPLSGPAPLRFVVPFKVTLP